MSSRALRRLQREEEERKQLEQLRQERAEQESDADESSEDNGQVLGTSVRPTKNAFDFLNAAEDESGDEEDDEADGEATTTNKPSTKDDSSTQKNEPNTSTAPSRRKRRKPKKKKAPQKGTSTDPIVKKGGLDEIDLALRTLRTDNKNGTSHGQTEGPSLELRTFYSLLATESKHLNALNEMKKLFGNTVIEGEREGNAPAAARRRGRERVQLDLGAALMGRNSPVSRGQGLAGLALKRNIFVPGKEEWPKATSGGLGMEVVEKAWDFTTEYKFVHGSIYQGVQREFAICVESLDPQRMIQLLQYNPYHISTLLQVAEIAKQQGDHSVSVDLLERALFTFGRSVHSTFGAALSDGKARLDFRRPENREFWLTAYRYIGALGQRGTWRTAFEWAKLLLSLDPEDDPYSIRLIIDQLALRGGQFEPLVELANTPLSVIDWGQGSPNIQISLAMAYHKLKNDDKARDTLQSAIRERPWILAQLFKELEVEPIPKSIWGRQPRTDHEELLSAAYVLRAKDIWNTPEALALLRGIADTADRVDPPLPNESEEISLNEARHIIFTDMHKLIALLPRSITTQRTTSSDPFPPLDNVISYPIFEEPDEEELAEQEIRADEREFQGIQSWFTNMLGRIGMPLNFNIGNFGPANANDFPIDQVAEALENSGLDIDELASRTTRLEELRIRQLAAEERLRTLESNLNIVNTRAAEADFLPTEAPAPVVNPAPGSGAEASSSGEPVPERPATNAGGYDDEANQRWLAGRGMLRLKDFIAEHGSDENQWKDDLDIDVTPATLYAHNVTLLQKRASKDFILNYSLKQGAGAEASDLIKRLIGA